MKSRREEVVDMLSSINRSLKRELTRVASLEDVMMIEDIIIDKVRLEIEKSRL